MTPRLLTLFGVAVGLTVLAGGAAVWWPRPDTALRVERGRLVGETTGYVAGVGVEDRTLQVSASIFGFRPLVVHIDRETTILVGHKEGGLGDLLPGMPVRVAYEMEGDSRIAKVIELGVAGGMPRSTPPTATPPTASILVDLPGVAPMNARDESAPPSSGVAPRAAGEEVPTAAPAASEPAVALPPSPSDAHQPVLELPPRQPVARPSSLGARANVPPAPPSWTLPSRESVLDLSVSVRDWIEAAKRRDVSAQIALYAERIGIFYGAHDYSREDVRAEKLRAFGSGEVLVDTGSPEIRLEPSGRAAIVRFSKRFVVDSDGRAQFGEAVQELRWERADAGWRIVDEGHAPMLLR